MMIKAGILEKQLRKAVDAPDYFVKSELPYVAYINNMPGGCCGRVYDKTAELGEECEIYINTVINCATHEPVREGFVYFEINRNTLRTQEIKATTAKDLAEVIISALQIEKV